MNTLEKIEQELTKNLKEKNEKLISILRMLKSALKNKEIELQHPLSEEEIVEVISKEAKKRKESAQAFRDGGRDDMAEKEQKEYEFLNQYLPEQLSEDELRKVIQETITSVGATSAADMGKVIGSVMQKVKNQAEGGLVSSLVKDELSKI